MECCHGLGSCWKTKRINRIVIDNKIFHPRNYDFYMCAHAGMIEKFNGEAINTLYYVVNQSNYTLHTLRNVTEYLSLAKSIKVAEMFLPSNIMDDIDNLNVDLHAAANTLSNHTNENYVQIRKVFNVVYMLS